MGLGQSQPLSEDKVKENMKNRWANLPNQSPSSTTNQNQSIKSVDQVSAKPISLVTNQSSPQGSIQSKKTDSKTEIIKEVPKEKVVDKKPPVQPEVKTEEPKIVLEKKKVDPKILENNLIENIFEISLNDKSKKYFLEYYKADLLSNEKEILFKIQDLDEIILSIIQNSKYKDNITQYFFNCYSRVFELGQKNNNDNIEQIKNFITTYLGQLITSPGNFGLTISQETITNDIKNFFENSDENEIISLLLHFISTSENDEQSLSFVFGYLFMIINMENKTNQTFYKCDAVRKNLSILTQLFEKSEVIKKIFVQNQNFLPQNSPGNLIQMYSFLGAYINLNPFECDQNVLKLSYPKQIMDNDASVKSFSSKLNNLVLNVTNMFSCFLRGDEKIQDKFMNYFYEIIKTNFEYEQRKDFRSYSVL